MFLSGPLPSECPTAKLDSILNWLACSVLLTLSRYMETSTDTPDSYVIVGAGVFGTSAALHLTREHPDAHITLIDRGPFPHEAGASWDWNKVVRADYTSLVYMELALEALKSWRSDPLFNTFYHQTGIVWADPSDRPRAIIDNYKKLQATEKYRMSDPSETKSLWGGIYSDANYTNVSEILINESSGWAEATNVLRQVTGAAVDAGVRYVEADVRQVVFDDAGAATGVRTSNGDVLSARHVIVATGVYTPKLLLDSAPQRSSIHAGSRMIAAGICEGSVILNDEDADYFSKGPVYVNEVQDVIGGVIPPTPENRLKFYRDQSFANTILHEASQQNVSVPPDQTDYDQWTLSAGMKEEISRTVEGIFGNKSTTWEITDYRICWDLVTPTQDPIICEHPHAKNLYLATGGSFHSWKFLPILGKYIAQMIKGTLDPELAEKWAWDREDNGSAHEGLLPTREMRDV
ncbi:hypothetical protein S40285_07268 [Stachybotrys chlorohalonatus IBT 40285]|uniref:FAD dependent oxidoreductase domain-containing protein n=1 Tax=Stachybotrys chlorohalonatus (strain IBT 40285) TaxID=1283841 RepID=A0A084QZZ7_STAC4|nr:hypothetical protein S40285_07268 [Stachybotrys chlorohalonata IBT 40285]